MVGSKWQARQVRTCIARLYAINQPSSGEEGQQVALLLRHLDHETVWDLTDTQLLICSCWCCCSLMYLPVICGLLHMQLEDVCAPVMSKLYGAGGGDSGSDDDHDEL